MFTHRAEPMPPSEQPVIRTIFGLPADMAHVVVSLEEAPPCLGTNFNMFRVRVTYPIFLLVQVRGLTGKMIGMLVVVRSSGRARKGQTSASGSLWVHALPCVAFPTDSFRRTALCMRILKLFVRNDCAKLVL